MSESNSREIALEILEKVLVKKWTFDDACERNENIKTLDQRDRNFVRAMVLSTLRHKGGIDHFLHGFTREFDDILRLGVAQLKVMGMPAHAVVNEMVKLAENHKTSFTNAVLRKAATEKMECRPRLNFLKWLLGSWEKAYGAEKVAAMLPLMLQEPALDITLKRGHRLQVTGDNTVTRDLKPVTLPNGSLRLQDAGNVAELPGYAQGEWWVQDAASTFAVKMLGDVKGKRVLDMCAAPGGKTAQLCDAGAVVMAVDDSQRRLKRLEENMVRLGFKPEVVCADGREIGKLRNWENEKMGSKENEKMRNWENGNKGNDSQNLNFPISQSPNLPVSQSPSFPSSQFPNFPISQFPYYDCVIVDAPCTATGTIQRNPEILHIRTPDDVKEMVKLQNELVDSAHNLLEPGGTLLYSVCSLQYEEGEGLVKKLNPEKWALAEQKRILPTEFEEFGGIGGFFCARLVKAGGR